VSVPSETPPAPRRLAPRGLGAAGLALAGLLLTLGALAGEDGLRRLSFNYLWAFCLLWTLVLGGLFFLALHFATGATWSVPLRRIAEMFAAPVAPLAALFLPVLLLAVVGGGTGLFPWLAQGDSLLAKKSAYLNLPFFLVRAGLFFGLWFLYARLLLGGSLRPGEGPEELGGRRRASAHFLPVFALTVTFASFDWLMSLEPHWFSTIFGVYLFSGMALTGLAAVTLAALRQRSRGALGLLRAAHLYNLGALLFAFTCFWGYIAFSQYMLIWYANIPEETVFFAHRSEHGWLPVSIALGLLRFAAPFALLLPRRAKSSPAALAAASALVLLGQALDLYWLIMPQSAPGGPVFGLPELGPPLLAAGLALLWSARFLGRHPALAERDPGLPAARAFHL